MTITVKYGQSIFDVCLENYGSLEYLFTLLADNDLTINSKLQSGQEIVINNLGIGDENIKSFVSLQKKKFNNNQTILEPPIVGGAYSGAYSSAYS